MPKANVQASVKPPSRVSTRVQNLRVGVTIPDPTREPNSDGPGEVEIWAQNKFVGVKRKGVRREDEMDVDPAPEEEGDGMDSGGNGSGGEEETMGAALWEMDDKESDESDSEGDNGGNGGNDDDEDEDDDEDDDDNDKNPRTSGNGQDSDSDDSEGSNESNDNDEHPPEMYVCFMCHRFCPLPSPPLRQFPFSFNLSYTTIFLHLLSIPSLHFSLFAAFFFFF